MRNLLLLLSLIWSSVAFGQTNNYNILDKALYPTTYGTASQCWTSNGNGVAPSWQACSGGGGGSSVGTGLQYGNGSGGFVQMTAMNGDCTLVLATGVITCTKINGAALPSIGTLATGCVLTASGSASIVCTELTGYVKATGGVPTASATIPLTDIATQAANTVLLNATNGVATPTAFAMPSCADTGTNHLNYVAGTGITCGTSGASGTVTAVSVATANGVSGTSSGGATPALTISLGDVTPSSVVASGGVSAGTVLSLAGIESTVTAAGTTQGTGTALSATKSVHVITTATNNQGVVLPSAVAGQIHFVKNQTGTANAYLKVYPASGETIGALAANASITLYQGIGVILVSTSTGSWTLLNNTLSDSGSISSTVTATGNFQMGLSANVSATTSLQLASRVVLSATAPTLASGGCTSPSAVTSSGTSRFSVNVGTSCSGSQPLVFTLPTATTGWNCFAQNSSNAGSSNPAQSSGISTTSVTVTNYSRTTGLAAAWSDSDVVVVSCLGG